MIDAAGCSNADSDWLIRISTNPPSVDPQVQILLTSCKVENAILEPMSSTKDNLLPH